MSFCPRGAAKPAGVEVRNSRYRPLIDAGLADQCQRFAEHFNDRGAEEIAAELRHAAFGISEITNVLCPIASSRDAAALIAAASPPATMKSRPAAATSGRPNTGAATNR